MSKIKKKFACGHQDTIAWEDRRQQKNSWEATFAQDPIDLRTLPKNVVLKARDIIEGLQNQKNYRDYHGKRLRHDRFIISIPVTRNYRLLCHDYGTFLVPVAVISHEDYNVCKPGG
jgi:hypothetical protein